MISAPYKGYKEGEDIAKLPAEYLGYPSKNVLCYKGVVKTRKGIKNDGTVHTANTRIHSEYVWKSAPGGAKALRVFGSTLQVKWVNELGKPIWITLFTGLSATTTRVRFTSWVDINGSIIKSRLFFVDGSESIYEWNGSIATVASISTTLITISETSSLLALGFDAGDSVNQNVRVVKFAAGVVSNITAYLHDDVCTDTILNLTTTPSPTPTVGDLVMSSVVTRSLLSGISKDDIYSYRNQLHVGTFKSGRIYYSHATTYPVTYTVPGTKTAITADIMDLEGNYTAMIGRKNILWISTVDDWYKITKTNAQNTYGYWTTVEKFEQSERTGALPCAVAIHKGDIVFLGQNKYLYRITTLEIIGIDDIRLISDEIEGLLLRLNTKNVSVKYDERYIFIVYPEESTLLMLDTIVDVFQPPQTLPVSCLSVIDGVRYGHSNARNETFQLFIGRNDLGTRIEAIIAPGYLQGEHEFRMKKHTLFGMHARATITTKVTTNHFYEEAGAKGANEMSFTVNDIKQYAVSDDVSFAAQSLATRSFAGVSDENNPAFDNDLKGFFIFDKYIALSWFNYRPVFTITGEEVELHLLGWYIDDHLSETKIPNDLFIQR